MCNIIGEPNNSGGNNFSLIEGCAQFVHRYDCMMDQNCQSSSFYICRMGKKKTRILIRNSLI